MSTRNRQPAFADLSARLPEFRRAEGTTAGTLEVALARVERPESRRVAVLEGSAMTSHTVPASNAGFLAFLDGIQQSRVEGWIGTIPLVYAATSAVIRLRDAGRFTTWQGAPERYTALYAPWSRLSDRQRALAGECGFSTREVRAEEGDDPHPLRLLQDTSNAVKQDREALEGKLAAGWALQPPGMLYLDGGIPANADVHASTLVTGVVKSHQTLYADADVIPVVLGLEEGTRSSAFAIESRHRPPVASWYLRLRSAAGRDPFFGLVRVEVPLAVWDSGRSSMADERSGWVNAERSPLALPDGRWDTMAYGIRDCEEYLRATL